MCGWLQAEADTQEEKRRTKQVALFEETGQIRDWFNEPGRSTLCTAASSMTVMETELPAVKPIESDAG
jgi:hypothetical protein